MSSVLPFDVIGLIIDTVGDNDDMDLLKELALVSHSFLQICNKYLFASVELHDGYSMCQRASSKRGFVKLLERRPDVVKYIRKLTYNVSPNTPFHGQFRGSVQQDTEDHLLSPILPIFLQTISRLKRLTISASKSDWTTLDSSLTSAFLHLMHLPTINHIDLSFIKNVPLSSLTPCANLHQLDIYYLEFTMPHQEDVFPELEMPIRICQFSTSDSSLLTRNLLNAKRLDGESAFDFTGLKQLSMSFYCPEDERNSRYLLKHAKYLEKLHLFAERGRLSLLGLHDILSPSARILKTLELTIPLCDDDFDQGPLAGLCDALEAMAGHNVLETLAFEVNVDGHETEAVIGSMIQQVVMILVKPGWSALKQVSVKILIACCLATRETIASLCQALQSLPDKYLDHLLTLNSIEFDYSAYVVKCAFDLT